MENEGHHLLTDVSEIVVTQGFLDLSKKRKICNPEENFEDCKTMKFIQQGIEKCRCIPLALSADNYSSDQVIHLWIRSIIVLCIDFQKPPDFCNQEGLQCYKNITIDTKKCLISCTGMYADTRRKLTSARIENVVELTEIIENYKKIRLSSVPVMDPLRSDTILNDILTYFNVSKHYPGNYDFFCYYVSTKLSYIFKTSAYFIYMH